MNKDAIREMLLPGLRIVFRGKFTMNNLMRIARHISSSDKAALTLAEFRARKK